MANLFNGRLDLNTITPVSGQTNLWDITGTLFEATGQFSAIDAKVGDVIYNDCSILSLGVIRFKIVSIDPSTSGPNLICRIQWDSPEAQPIDWTVNDYPISGVMDIIGTVDDIGTMAVTSMTQNFVDEAFVAAVRNAESFRHSLYLSVSNPSLLTGTPMALQYKLPTPADNSELLVGNTDNSLTWTKNLDFGTF
jgi:hypothetical protein